MWSDISPLTHSQVVAAQYLFVGEKLLPSRTKQFPISFGVLVLSPCVLMLGYAKAPLLSRKKTSPELNC